ncbi:hypothetical protein [Alicyclobacillus acidiphilus]|uniref:hypothetical protein n=1 Tax=Alicyclobacillus acidiphilus TaxID=182455 RepID=UPI000832169A|nr:hypothetical protein [Alicyclobacillus acidiphilus]
MSLNMTETEAIREQYERRFDALHERYPQSKIELANAFTFPEALLILCLCCKLPFVSSSFDQNTLIDIYLDSTESRNVDLALRTLQRKCKQLNEFQTYAVLVMARECLCSPTNGEIESEMWLKERVRQVFGIKDSELA